MEKSMDDAIARFRPKLARFLEETQLELRPPISSAELERFETRHKVRLPEAYREFLLRVTNGIVWMDGNLVRYWMFPLSRWLAHMDIPADRPPPDYLSLPCCLTPEMIEKRVWTQFRDSPAYEREYIDAGGKEREELFHGCGMVALLDHGCGYYNTLVVSGPYAGRVVYFAFEDQPPYFAPEPDFLTWLERQIDEQSRGESDGYWGWGPPGDELKVLEEYPDLPKAVFLRALFRFPTLSAPTMERVRECLAHENPLVRWLAVELIVQKADPVEYLATLKNLAVTDPDPEQRVDWLHTLTRRAESARELTSLLEQFATTDPDESCRTVAIRWLAQNFDKATPSAGLFERIAQADPHESCRAEAIRWLAENFDESASSADLFEHIARVDPASDCRILTIRKLSEQISGRPERIALFEAIATADSDFDCRVLAIRYLANHWEASEERIALVEKIATSDPDEYCRAEARRAQVLSRRARRYASWPFKAIEAVRNPFFGRAK
jgi:hypothetical protein